jgi:hypothetical protein
MNDWMTGDVADREDVKSIRLGPSPNGRARPIVPWAGRPMDETALMDEAQPLLRQAQGIVP